MGFQSYGCPLVAKLYLGSENIFEVQQHARGHLSCWCVCPLGGSTTGWKGVNFEFSASPWRQNKPILTKFGTEAYIKGLLQCAKFGSDWQSGWAQGLLRLYKFCQNYDIFGRFFTSSCWQNKPFQIKSGMYMLYSAWWQRNMGVNYAATPWPGMKLATSLLQVWHPTAVPPRHSVPFCLSCIYQ